MPNDPIVYEDDNQDYYKLAYTGPQVDELLGKVYTEKTNVNASVNGYIGFGMGWGIMAVGRMILQTYTELCIDSDSNNTSSINDAPAGMFLQAENLSEEDQADFNQDLMEGVTADEPTDIGDVDWTPVTGGYISSQITLPLDMPIKWPVIVGSTDRDQVTIVRTNAPNGTKITFRLFSPTSFASSYRIYARMMVAGRRRPAFEYPPWRPIYSGQRTSATNEGIVILANSYNNARINGRKFAYGPNFTYNSNPNVNNENGYALLECDTLLTMVMLGIPYNNSPYADNVSNGVGPANYQYPDEWELPGDRSQTNTYPWCEYYFKWIEKYDSNHQVSADGEFDNGFGKRITWTSSQNWWLWDNSCIFKNALEIRSGDIIIFRRPNATSFDNIGHVAILEINDGITYMIHVSSSSYTDGHIIDKIRLDEYLATYVKYDPENIYYARPVQVPQKNAYPTGYRVMYNSDDKWEIYESLVDNNTCEPTVNPEGGTWTRYWQKVEE